VLSLALGFILRLRVAIAVLLITPLGILLGVPFSTGLRMVNSEAPLLVPWAWAVNGFFTVIGSVVAMILGMILGLTAVFIIAAGCYLVASIAIRIGPEQRARGQELAPKLIASEERFTAS
jgi:hypothetical protein